MLLCDPVHPSIHILLTPQSWLRDTLSNMSSESFNLGLPRATSARSKPSCLAKRLRRAIGSSGRQSGRLTRSFNNSSAKSVDALAAQSPLLRTAALHFFLSASTCPRRPSKQRPERIHQDLRDQSLSRRFQTLQKLLESGASPPLKSLRTGALSTNYICIYIKYIISLLLRFLERKEEEGKSSLAKVSSASAEVLALVSA